MKKIIKNKSLIVLYAFLVWGGNYLFSQQNFKFNLDKADRITAASYVGSLSQALFFVDSKVFFYSPDQPLSKIEWFAIDGLEKITAVVSNGDDELLVFDGSYYVQMQPSTGTLLSDWEQWPGLPTSWRGNVTSAVNWNDSSVLLLNNNDYVLYDFSIQEYTQSGSIMDWPGWPKNWLSGVDAGFNLGDGFLYFFNDGEVTAYSIQEQSFYSPRSISGANPYAEVQIPQIDESNCVTGIPNSDYVSLNTPEYGFSKGREIQDEFKAGMKISKIKVFTSKIWGKTVVCGLQTVLEENGTEHEQQVFGKTSNTFKQVVLQVDECIIGISGSVGGEVGNYLNNIQILTSLNTSPVFGNKFPKDDEPFSIMISSNERFDGFYGSFDNSITSVGMKYFGKQKQQSSYAQRQANLVPVENQGSPVRQQTLQKKQYEAGLSSITAEQAMQMGMGVPPPMVEGIGNGSAAKQQISEQTYQIIDAYIDDYDDFTSEIANMTEFMAQPLSGIDWLGAGFDILYYDPMNPNEVSNRKSFRTILVTNSLERAGNKSQYLKPFGSEFFSANAGVAADSTSWVTSYQQFTNSFNISMSPSVSVPGVASGSFSPSFSQMNSSSVGSESIYMFNKIKRKIHEVELNLTWIDNLTGQKYKQKTDRGFKNDVANLPVPTGSVNHIEVTEKNQKLPSELTVLQGKYYGLIKKYGTHFAQKVAYGGQYIARTQIKRSQYEKTRMTEAGFKAEAEATIKGVTVGNKVDFGYKDGSTTQKGNEAFKRDVFVQGGNGEDDLDKWRDKVDQNMAPIEIYFAPISDILNPKMFADDPDIEKKGQILALMIDKYVTDKYREGVASKNDFFRELPDLPIPGNVMVKNGGGYVMWFSVKYEYEGRWVTKESGNFTLGFTEDIEIPVGARNITITAEQTTGEIFTETLDKPEIICFKCGGTIFKTNYSKCDG